MRRSPSFSLNALRKFAGLAAVLALAFALIPRGYMPALAKSGTDGARVIGFVICHGATPDAAVLLPDGGEKSPTDHGTAPNAGDCPFAPIAGFLTLAAAAAPVIEIAPAWHAAPPPAPHWTAPGLPYFPRPSGARAPPFSCA